MSVAYYDHKEVAASPVLMLQLMLVQAGKASDSQLARSVCCSVLLELTRPRLLRNSEQLSIMTGLLSL